MTDSIGPAEAKALLQAIVRYDKPAFYFEKFYELTLSYQQFLLVRMRFKEHALVAK